MAKKTSRKKSAPKKAARSKAPRKKAVARKAPPKKAAKRAFVHRRDPQTLRLRAIAPSITVNDIEKSLTFYRDVLGFVVKDRWERDGKLAGAEFAAGAVTFLLGQDDWKKGRDRAKGEGISLYCQTAQNVDELARRIKVAGGNVVQEPKDQPWGMRDFAVLDLDGFRITLWSELKS
jgi:lactoylglutathione lyase